MRSNSSSLITIAALIIILAAVRSAQQLVLPFLLAFFISIIAAAPVAWLRGKRVPAGAAVAIVLGAMLLAMAGATMLLAASAKSFSEALPVYLDRLQGFMDRAAGWMARTGLAASERGITEIINPGAAMRLVNSLLGGLTQLLSNTFLIVMTVIFMLLEAPVFSAKLAAIRNDAGRTVAAVAGFLESTQNYMGLKAAISLATGVLIGAAMAALGVDYAVLWGFLAFLLNFIPNIGSIIAAVPAVLLAWLQLGYRTAMLAAACFLAVNMLIGNFVEPRIMGKGMGLSTLVVFLSLVFWGWLLGPVGMLLSVPLTLLVKAVAGASARTRWIAVLLSADADEPV